MIDISLRYVFFCILSYFDAMSRYHQNARSSFHREVVDDFPVFYHMCMSENGVYPQ